MGRGIIQTSLTARRRGLRGPLQQGRMPTPDSVLTRGQQRASRWLIGGVVVLAVDTAHLAFFSRADGLTALMVGLHIVLGVLIGVFLLVFAGIHLTTARRFPNRRRRRFGLLALVSLGVAVASGGALLWTGAFGPGRVVLAVHFASGVAGLVGLALHLAVRLRRDVAHRWPVVLKATAGVAAATLAAAGVGEVWRYRVERPEGEAHSFFPTSATTANGRLIPAEEMMASASCGECHQDIYDQWFASQHHHGSFSNPFYRRAVQYAGERLTDAASNFCGGCHDPAPTFAGQMSAFLDPESAMADAGVSCVGCHAIVKTEPIGNGSYVVERPQVYPFAYSSDERWQAVNRFLIRVKPGPHRKAFLKPFHKDNSAFCAACHKVHIPKVINQFRWVRGYNQYDAWQQSSWSGQAVGSFYYAEEPKSCQGCHMKETPSADAVERRRGFVHDHRFTGSNTVLPLLRGDSAQLRRVVEFLTDPDDPKVTVDIFAGGLGRRFGEGASDPSVPMVAPLNRGALHAVPGEWLRVEVVVRNRGVGHNFPAGTTDLWDVWLEFRVTDGAGRVLFHSGSLEGDPGGDVDPGAHFFRVVLLDELGRRIDKGNRWDIRTTLYNTTVPAGTADVVRYRFWIPEDAQSSLVIEAKLNYRKYSDYFARWVFGGHPMVGQDSLMTVTSDGRDWVLAQAPLPTRPVVTMARDSVSLRLSGSDRTLDHSASAAEEAERFNDYGIALLRQQDLMGARRAFEEVVRLAPGYADGHVNLARVALAAGAFADGEAALAQALALEPGFLKARYFRALLRFRLGRFDEALADFEAVRRSFPRDREVLFQLGRTLYVQGDYRRAVKIFEAMLVIDPEEARAYYNLMLCHRHLGEEERAAWAATQYETYRLDFDINRVTGPYRNRHPQESREAELVHEHSHASGEPQIGTGAP